MLFLCWPLLCGRLYGFDAVADFSTNANPNGVWSYGWSTNAGGLFQSLSNPTSYDTGQAAGWNNGLSLPNAVVVAKFFGSNYDFFGSAAQFPDTLRMDPQSDAAIVRFTAPSNGNYQINGLFRVSDSNPQADNLTILANGSTIYHVLTVGGSLYTQYPFGFSFPMNSGDTLDFVVSCQDGVYNNLSTGLKVSITPAMGATYLWNGAVSNSWSTASNWTPAGRPGPSDTVVITNGSPVVGTAATVGAVILNAGASIYAPGGLTVSKLFNWEGGNVTGQLTIGTNATLNLNDFGGNLSLQGLTLINDGTVVWDGGALVCDPNTIVTNDGQWVVQVDNQFNSVAGAGVFYNNGSFVESASGSTTAFYGLAFCNAGVVNLTNGALNLAAGGVMGGSFLAGSNTAITLSGGGLLTGVFSAGQGATVTLSEGAFTNDKAVFNGPGSATLAGGTLLLSNDVSPNLLLAGGTVTLGPQFQSEGAITNLTIAGATLAGANNVTGVFNWIAGQVAGALTVAQSGTVYLSGSADVYLYAALTNAGQIIWNGAGAWHLDSNSSGGWVVNLPTGVIDAQCDEPIQSDFGGEWINNAGLFEKSMGTQDTAVAPAFTNSGVVKVLTGSMDFQGGYFGGLFVATNGTVLNFDNGGVLSGTFSAGFGALINLAGGSFTPSATVSFGGAGACEFTGGTLALSGEPIPNLQLAGGTIELAAGFEGGTITDLTLYNETLPGTNIVTGVLTFNGQNNSVLGPLTVASGAVLNFNGGFIAQPLILEPGATVNWNGGAVESFVTIASNAVLNVNGSMDVYDMMTNAGVVNWNGGSVQVENGKGVYNLAGAVFNINVTAEEVFYYYYGTEFFNNAGLVQKSAANSSVYFEPVLINTGTVQVQGGLLDFDSSEDPSPVLGGQFLAGPGAQIWFDGGGLLAGSFSASTNAIIRLDGGAFSNNVTATYGGAGTNEISGGTLTLGNDVIPNLQIRGGTITLSPGFQGGAITNLNLGGASLVGANTVAGVLTMNGGALSGSLLLAANSTFNFSGTLSAPLTVPSQAVMNITGPNETDIYDSLTNYGTINWTGGDLYLYSGVSINNFEGAVFNTETANLLYSYYATAAFNNTGLFLATNNVGTAYIDVPFNNLGRVEAGAGAAIDFEYGGYLSGTYTAWPGGTIEMSYGIFSNSPSVIFSGSGSNLLDGGTITLATNPIPNLQYLSGSTIVLGPQFQGGTITNLTLNGATLAGTNTVTGLLNMNGGTAAGPLIVASGGVMNLTGPDDLYLDSAVTNAGTINWLGGNLYLDSTNSFQNLPGALFAIQCNLDLGFGYYYYPALFVNAGTVTKSGPAGGTYFNVPLANSGTVNVMSGELYFESGGALSGAYVAAAGAQCDFEGGSFTNTSAPVSFSGAGVNALTGGSLYLPSNTVPDLQLLGGTVYLGPGFQGGTITNLTLNGAGLGGTNTVTGLLNITGSNYSYMQGPLVLAPNSVFNCGAADFYYPLSIAAGAVMNIGGPYGVVFAALSTNQGTINWTNGTVSFDGPFYNLSNALFNVQCDQEMYSYGSQPVYNFGVIRKTNSTGITHVYPSIVNTGAVEVESGEFYLAEAPGLTGGVWIIGISGLNNYGQFGFGYSVALTNALDISLVNGFLFSPGETFTLATYPSETGSFAFVTVQPSQGGNYGFNYGPPALTFTVNSVVVPSIAIVSPTNSEVFRAGNSIPISVNYSDTNTTVLQVQYYQNSTLIGSATNNFTWNSAPAGFHALTAVATDAAGSVATSAPVAILVVSNTEATGSFIWTGASSTNWSDSGNWQPAGPPGAGANVFVSGGPPINLDISPTVNYISLGGGALGGTGTLTVNGQFDWSAGALGAPVNITAGATFYINATNSLDASGATLANLGNILWTGGNLLANAATTISNGGLWTIASAGNLSCAANFINTGSITASNATVSFTGGGTLLGSMTAGAQAANYLADGSFEYGAGATFDGPGSNSFTGGTLTLSNDLSTNLALVGGTVLLGPAFQFDGAITNLTLSGSTLAGTNTVTGFLDLAAGQITGQLTVARGGRLEFSGAPAQYLGLENLTLINSGTVFWSGGILYAGNAVVTNNGVWLIETNGSVNSPFSLFVNNGSLTQEVATGTTVFAATTFVNNGTIDAETGTLDLSAGGSLGGTYNAATNADISFVDGNLSVGALPNITGEGTVQVVFGSTLTILSNVPAGLGLTGGTVVLGPGFQANGVITNLTLNGATLSGSYTVTGTLNCLAGSISGALTIASNATLNLPSSATGLTLSSGALTNDGSVIWAGGEIDANYGTLFVNNGLWLAASDNQFYSDYYDNLASFINNGIFRKMGTAGYTTFYSISFTNFGTVDAQSGTIQFEGGGGIGGAYNAASQAFIYFDGGAFSPAGAPTFAGSGAIDFSGGTLTLTNNQIPGLPVIGGEIILGPAFQNNGAITNLTLQGAVLSGAYVVTGVLNCLSGSIDGSLTIARNATLNLPSSATGFTLSSGALTNNGSVIWAGGEIDAGYGTLFVNNGLWLAASDSEIYGYYYYYYYYYYYSSLFINNGIFRKTASSGSTYIETFFDNNGLVDAQSGNIFFDSGGQIGGVYNAAAAATIALEGGYFTNSYPASFTGAGLSEFDGGILTLMSDQIPSLPLAGGEIVLGPAFQDSGAITNLTLGSGAALEGTNTVTGTLNCSGATIAGALTVATSGQMNISNASGDYGLYLDYDAMVNNFGTVTWSGGYVTGYSPASSFITNSGLWLVQCDDTLEEVTFANPGVFRKSATTGATTLDYLSFINSGTLDAQSGAVNFNSISNYGQTLATLAFGVSAPNLTGTLSIAGNVNLDGALAVTLLNGYTPNPGDAFTLINYGSAAGSFSQFNLPALPAGLDWETDIGSTGVGLRVVQALAASHTLSLSGTVSDSNHHPIAGVTVYVTLNSSNLIQNGSFEQPSIGYNGYEYYQLGSTNITGWTVIGPAGGNVELVSQYWRNVPAEDGAQFLDPSGNIGGGGVTQTFPTVAGTAYDLIFYHGTATRHGVNDCLGVGIGTNFYTFGETSGGSGNFDWRQVVIPFTASSNLTTLTIFSEIAGYDANDFVDNVQVIPPDGDRLLEAVTDASGNYQISVGNEAFQVDVAGLGSAGYNAVASQSVVMGGADQVLNFVATPLSTAATFRIATSANPPDAGRTLGAGAYTSGAAVTVTALATNAAIPFFFTNWTQNGVVVSLAPSYTFVAESDRDLVANFALPTFTISASNNPSVGGSVSGAGPALWGTTNVLVASPAFGFAFGNWTLDSTVVGTDVALTNIVTSNATYVANYVATNVTHRVTVATSPTNVAAVSGAGTYSNGQTATIKAPLSVTNLPDVYSFQYFTLNGAYVSSSADLSVVMSTLLPESLTYVAVYEGRSLLPQLVSVSANYANPVPKTTNFVLRLQFDRAMKTSVAPLIVLSNAVNPAPVVGTNGHWTTAVYANDTYFTPGITFGPGMDGTVQVWVLGAQDTGGNKLALTNALTLTVRSTPPVVAISSPTNGLSLTTTNVFLFAATATSVYGVAGLALYENASNLVASFAASNASFTVSNLAAGSYALTAVATDTTGLSATSAVVHVTVNTPGTTLIDFEALDASAGPVSGAALSNYLAGYGVAVGGVSSNTAVAVQADFNFLGGAVTVASSGDNLLTQTGTNGTVSYTLSFNRPYPGISWTRTELLAGTGGVETPAWRATAYDTNGVAVGSVGEKQVGSFTNVPARRFTLSGPDIASVTFAGDNSIGVLSTLPLDDLLLSSVAPGSALTIDLSAAGSVLSAPGQIQLNAQAAEPGGTIVEIDFYEGSSPVGSVLAAAGSSLTNAGLGLTDVAAGAYNFTAVATDSQGAVRSSATVPVTVAAVAGVSVINFDTLDTSVGAVGGALLSNYLAGFGVTPANVTLGTRLEAVNQNNLSSGAGAIPSSPPNLFTQVGLNQPVTFTLQLGAAVGSVSFTRVALVAGPGGVSDPAWSAHALDAAGVEVESVGEPLFFSATNVPARTFELTGQGITRVRFDSDSAGAASFSAVLLDDLVLNTNRTAAALSIILEAPTGGLTSPADIPLSATVSDSLGTVQSVAFYAGPNLIGTASGGSFGIIWSNMLAGTYVLTAEAFDSAGYARVSSPVSVTVTAGVGNSKLVNFDSLNASNKPVTGAALSNYLAGFGMTLANVTAGTQVAVENQSVLAGGGFVAASSPPNLLTQIGAGGPASFKVLFSPWLAEFTFTRPELLANPFVTHPAWKATAYDALGVPLAQAGEGLTASYTNVPAQSYSLQGPGIAGVEFDSQGGSLTTFSAALLDDFILTTPTNVLPPAVVLTNPVAGQVFTAPAVITLGARALAADGAVSNVSFYAGTNLLGVVPASPYLFYWTNATPGAYALTAVATDDAGLIRTSPPVAVTVSPAPTQFGILTQPVGATVAAGSGVILSVQTTGTNAVSYQWYQNTTPLAGQTQSVLSLAPVSDANDGTYTVAVTSSGQTLTSQGAVLTVLDAPVITAAPLSQQVNIGSNVTLTVGAGGSSPFTYQWTLNGTGIAGATNSTYTIAAAQPLSSGNYQVSVGNAVGSTQSTAAAVTVTVAGGPTLSADSFSNRISFNPLVGPVFGNNVNATSEPGEPLPDGKPGGKSIWYTWHASFSGVISLTTRGSSFDTLLAVYTGTNVAELTPIAADDDSGGFFTSLVTFNCVAGTDYQIDVDGFQGASGTVVLGLPSGTAYRVLNPTSGDTVPVITQPPASQVVDAGAKATLSVKAASASPLTYQWFFQNAPVAGAGASQLVLSNFQAGAVGRYYVLVANAVGSVPSTPVSLELAGASQGRGRTNIAQDKFGDAVDLSLGGNTPAAYRPQDGGGDTGGYSVSQTFSTVGATKEEGEPDPCGQAGGASEWYIYTPPAAGTLHMDTDGSDFNTILGLYTSAGPTISFASLTEQGCGYTTNYQLDPQPSINVPVAAGVHYYIVVDGYQGATGTARLNIGLGAPPQILTQPQSRPAVPGSSATFSVVAVGTTNFSYQWQFDDANVAGATASSYTLSNAQNIAVGDYRVIVSNVVGVVTSTPALLTLQSAPFIFGQPSNQSVNLSQKALFSVAGGGRAPLYYQWYLNGAPLAKATASTLTLASVKYSDAGVYAVSLSNSLGRALSSNAVLTVNETTRPTVKIVFPPNNYQSTNPAVAVRGTAGDARAVADVEVTVNNNVTQTAAGAARWTNVVTLVPGTNHVTVQSYNLAGLPSAPASLTIDYIVLSTLTLRTNGAGGITGETNQARLQIGKTYTLTAHPASRNLLSNWIGGDTLATLAPMGTQLALSFTMSSNLILQANFVTNPFPAVAGAYNGLFYPLSGVTEQSSGLLSLTLSSNQGIYSAKVYLAGGTNSLSGAFDLTGTAQNAFTNAGKQAVALSLHVNLNLNPPDDLLTGILSADGWQSELTADRAVFNGTTIKASNYAGRYTLIVPPGANAPLESPGGYGVANITNNLAGVAILNGSLGDGALFTQSVPISLNGVIPVYASLYGGHGFLLGWLIFSNEPPQTVSGQLNWIKLPVSGKGLYLGGFTNQAEIIGSAYETSGLALSNATLTIFGAEQSSPLVYTNITVAKGKLSYSGADEPTNQLSATFTAGTGAMTLSFRPTGAKANVTAQGVVLQSGDTNAAGWFLGTNQSGFFLLQQ